MGRDRLLNTAIVAMGVAALVTTLGAFLAGALENGSYVFGVPVPLPPQEGLSRDSVVYLLVSADGSDADTLVVSPGGEQYQRVSGGRVARMTNPLRPMPAAGASGDRITVGATDTCEIREFGPDGTATRLVRRAVSPQPSRMSIFARWPISFRSWHPRSRRSRVQARCRPFPRCCWTARTNLWVQDYPSPGAATVPWTVFDPRGVMLGQVALPAGFRATDIGADYVLGVWTDELGVERVRVYSLRKP